MSKIRVLIVDDEIPFTQSLKINLEDKGYEVRVENNAVHAVSSALEFLPDIILLDVVMPGLDGGDVSAQLKLDRTLRDIPVIMVTALVSNDETGSDAMMTSGNRLMVAKPIRLEKLTEIIEKEVGKTV